MVELVEDGLRFRFPELHEQASCEVSFQRTLRIPDDSRSYPLPPGLGRFPLHHVADHADRLPAGWSERGGVFLPMHQAEAVWILFESRFFPAYPMAVKVAAGKIDALTGQPFRNALRSRPQDYVVVPQQPWLDGFCVRQGVVRQFVAMPLGKGYTAEEQLTGEARYGGLQIVVYPMKPERYEALLARFEEDTVKDEPLLGASSLDAPGLGLAPGGLMRQEIFQDDHGFDAWAHDVRSRCFVHLLNSAQYREATRHAPPHEPPTAAAYTAAGLPWFAYYDADREALKGAKRLARLESVAARRVKEGKAPRDADAGMALKPGQVRRLGPTRHVVRDGTAW